MKRLLLILVFITIALLSYAQKPHNYREYRDSVIRSLIGKQYPEFNFTTTRGEVFSSKSTKGKVVLVNFWFKDCSPCRTEMEWLNALYDSLKTNPDFQFISIAREPKDMLPGYVNFFKINYPVVSLVDCDKYNYNSGFPINIIIDKQGKVAYYNSGGSPDRAKSRAEVLETLLPKIKSLL